MNPLIWPKNWATFQHYKQRRPPWIKLHRDILDNFDFQCLQDASKVLAQCLWIIASEHDDGKIPLKLGELSWRLRISDSKFLLSIKPLIDKGFFECNDDASKMLAKCLQDAMPETETEREVETENRDREQRTEPQAALVVTRGVQAPAPDKKKRAVPETAETWAAYSEAYFLRYHAQPARNKTVNSQMAQFVQRIGIEEAPHVAAFYVTHNKSWYVQGLHAVGYMLKDAEALRTQWATNSRVMQTQARQADKTASNPFARMLQDQQTGEDVIDV